MYSHKGCSKVELASVIIKGISLGDREFVSTVHYSFAYDAGAFQVAWEESQSATCVQDTIFLFREDTKVGRRQVRKVRGIEVKGAPESRKKV